jgi:hypothetical protein
MSRPPDDLLSTLLEYYAPEPARGAEAIRQAAAGNWLATLAELTLRDLAGYRQGEADAGDREKLAAALAQLFREGWTAGSRHEAARVAGGLTGEQEAAAIRQAGIAELRRTLQARKFFADDVANTIADTLGLEVASLVAVYLQGRIEGVAEAAFQQLRRGSGSSRRLSPRHDVARMRAPAPCAAGHDGR